MLSVDRVHNDAQHVLEFCDPLVFLITEGIQGWDNDS